MTRASFGFLSAALALSLAAPGTGVRALDLSGAYIGGNFGRAMNTWDTGFVDDQLNTDATNNGDTIDFTARSIRRMSDAWWADAGYFFSPYVGIDAAFLHIGEIKYLAVGTLTTSDGTTYPLSSSTEVVSHGPALSFIFRLPLTESFAADLRLGDYFGKATQDNTTIVNSHTSFSAVSKSTSSLLTGAGLSYTVAGHLSLRIDYLRVNHTGDSTLVGKFSVNMGTAGLSYTF
jgi:opacity protein-like surface antigen